MLDIFLGEALGLFVFVLVHGGILASMVLTGKVKEGLAALAVFLVISFGVFAALAGGSPGAHINPAVTMAVFVTGGIDALEALVYIASQIFGGLVGGVVLWVIYLPQFKAAGENALAPLTGNPNPKDVVQNVITSILGSFLLALLVLVTVKLTTGSNVTPLAVGAAVLAAALAFGGTSFSMLNVARDFGPRIAAKLLGLGKPTFIPALLLALASLVGGLLAGVVVVLLA
jgi:glycerol uptake facilitator protein